MQNKCALVQARVLYAVILPNFIAQIPYYVHLYAGRQAVSVTVRSSLVMGAVFAFYLLASWLLFKGQRPGYPLMLAFLAVEFLFYLFGRITSTLHGFAPFFQVRNPDVVCASSTRLAT